VRARTLGTHADAMRWPGQTARHSSPSVMQHMQGCMFSVEAGHACASGITADGRPAPAGAPPAAGAPGAGRAPSATAEVGAEFKVLMWPGRLHFSHSLVDDAPPPAGSRARLSVRPSTHACSSGWHASAGPSCRCLPPRAAEAARSAAAPSQACLLGRGHVRRAFVRGHPAVPAGGLRRGRGAQVTVWFPAQFAELRRLCLAGGGGGGPVGGPRTRRPRREAAFAASLSRCHAWAARGGKSKSYFAKARAPRGAIIGYGYRAGLQPSACPARGRVLRARLHVFSAVTPGGGSCSAPSCVPRRSWCAAPKFGPTCAVHACQGSGNACPGPKHPADTQRSLPGPHGGWQPLR